MRDEGADTRHEKEMLDFDFDFDFTHPCSLNTDTTQVR